MKLRCASAKHRCDISRHAHLCTLVQTLFAGYSHAAHISSCHNYSMHTLDTLESITLHLLQTLDTQESITLHPLDILDTLETITLHPLHTLVTLQSITLHPLHTLVTLESITLRPFIMEWASVFFRFTQ